MSGVDHPAPEKLPRHIAVIMDGNGRWAQERHLPRIMGHRAGVEAVRQIVKGCIEFGVPYLTLYAFSQENWKRPPQEISLLMELLDHFLDAELAELEKEGVRFVAIGRLEALPEGIQRKIEQVSRRTAGRARLTLIVALNYGARGEIVDAVRRILRERLSASRGASAEEASRLDETAFEKYLYTAGLPDPDMLIRTSGELRLSNFLLWQCSYSEIYISKKFWPDFGREDLVQALREFAERERRFGAIAAG